MKRNLVGSALFNHLLKESGKGNMMNGFRRLIDEAHAAGRRQGYIEGFEAATKIYANTQRRIPHR